MRHFPALIISDQTADGSTIEEKRNASKPEHVGGEKNLRFGGYFNTGCMGALWEGDRDKMCVCSDFPTGFELTVWSVHRDVHA